MLASMIQTRLSKKCKLVHQEEQTIPAIEQSEILKYQVLPYLSTWLPFSRISSWQYFVKLKNKQLVIHTPAPYVIPKHFPRAKSRAVHGEKLQATSTILPILGIVSNRRFWLHDHLNGRGFR